MEFQDRHQNIFKDLQYSILQSLNLPLLYVAKQLYCIVYFLYIYFAHIISYIVQSLSQYVLCICNKGVIF